jgi:hypothetical protein
MNGTARFDPMSVDLEGLFRAVSAPDGVPVRDRYHNLRRYPSCFEGSALVDHLVQRHGLSRKQAVRLGRRMLAHDLIHHVLGEHDFEDAPLFYEFGRREDARRDPVPEISRAALVELATSMRGPGGVVVGTHRHWLIDYPETVVGREVVDWIVGHTGLDRDGAAAVGRAMLAASLIRHVLDERDFEDGRRLYRFV